jgi:hypothetical protein
MFRPLRFSETCHGPGVEDLRDDRLHVVKRAPQVGLRVLDRAVFVEIAELRDGVLEDEQRVVELQALGLRRRPGERGDRRVERDSLGAGLEVFDGFRVVAAEGHGRLRRG